jgi:FkbM family methyltransferase
MLRKPRYVPGFTRIGGLDLEYADSASLVSTYRQVFLNEEYAYDRSIVAKYPLIIDCGANIGLASLYFARHSPSAHIIAFEPEPDIYRMLKRNLNRNRASHVETVNCALWKDNTVLAFASDGADSGHLVPESSRQTQVRTARLRDYLPGPVGLLKLDIEGSELEVLKDARDCLTNVHQIIIEHHSVAGKPQLLAEFFAILEEAGFRVQINNALRWINPLVVPPAIGRYEQLLIVYGCRVRSEQKESHESSAGQHPG